MTGEDFKRALRRVGLSVYAAAPFLGISPRHCQRIAAGEYPAPESVEKLLRLMHYFHVNPSEFEDPNW